MNVQHLRACLNIQYVIILRREKWAEWEKHRKRAYTEAVFRLNGRPCHITMAYSDLQRSRDELNVCLYVCVLASKYFAFDFCLYHVSV